jgi:D-alanyl-D-alanine carboxypeptidase
MRVGFIYFAPSHLKIFIGSFIAVFIMVILQMLGVHAPTLLSPLSEKKPTIFDTLQEILYEKQNTFRLRSSGSFIREAHAEGAYDEANAYAVVDLDTGEIYASKNSATPVAIASVTKIMTAVVALDLADPQEEITITENAASQIPTKIAVTSGEKLTLDELLHATLLTSANDAAQAIHDGINEKYHSDVFIWAMNEKAKAIGLKNTHFDNPQGFDGNNYSTAEDLSILTHYAYAYYPKFAEIVAKDYLFLEANGKHKEFDLYNWNGLIGVYPNTYGVKIGNTGRAKKTTVVAAKRDGKNIAVVLLGAPSILTRDMWAAQLLDIGFARAANSTPIAVTEEQLLTKYATWNKWN